jgi:hypothetical protein
MVLTQVLSLPSCHLYSSSYKTVLRTARSISQRPAASTFQIGEAHYLRRILPKSQLSWGTQRTWQSARLPGGGIWQQRNGLTRISEGENHKTAEDRPERKEQVDIVDVVAGPPSVEALAEFDSAVRVRGSPSSSSSSSAVFDQQQQSGTYFYHAFLQLREQSIRLLYLILASNLA